MIFKKMRAPSGAWWLSYEATKPWQVEIALYRTLRGEHAIGYTNHTVDDERRDRYALLLELDEKTIELEDWLRGLACVGLRPWLAAETKRGYHAVSGVLMYSKKDVAMWLVNLSTSHLCDAGIADLALIRRDDPETHFTNILRVYGKYSEKDIVVRRWLPPPTPWHAAILSLYCKYAYLEWSATRLARRCPGFVSTPNRYTERGKLIHQAWERSMQQEGWETERRFTARVRNMIFTCVADAAKDYGDCIEIIELKSTIWTARRREAGRQMIAEAAIAALATGKTAIAEIQTPGGEVWNIVEIEPSEAWDALRKLLKTCFRKPTCELCAFKRFCPGGGIAERNGAGIDYERE